MKLLSFLFVAIQFFGISSASADYNAGKKLQLVKDQSGVPLLTLVYSVKAPLAWMVGSVKQADLTGPSVVPAQNYFLGIVNKRTGETIWGWREIAVGGTHVRPDVHASFQIENVKLAEIEAISKSLKDALIVLTFDAETKKISHHIEISDVCASNPDNFQDLESSANPCN